VRIGLRDVVRNARDDPSGSRHAPCTTARTADYSITFRRPQFDFSQLVDALPPRLCKRRRGPAGGGFDRPLASRHLDVRGV
jgi:hypothetical protein